MNGKNLVERKFPLRSDNPLDLVGGNEYKTTDPWVIPGVRFMDS